MNFYRIFSLCMVFVGTVVGAGFASGLEIWLFFGQYGILGFLGVILSCLIISLCGTGINLGVYDGDFNSYGDFCRVISGKVSGRFFSVLGVIFMYSAFSIMLSGSGALFSQEFGRSYPEGVLLMALICFVVFVFGIKGLETVNLFLTPLMLFGITLLGIFSLISQDKSASVVFSDLLTVAASGVSAIIYVSYNLLSVPSVIIPLKKLITSRKNALLSGLLGGMLLGVCSILMYLSSRADGFCVSNLPALTLAMKQNRFFGLFYGITVYFSMLTTALGNGFGFIEILRKKLPSMHRTVISFIMCSSASFVALSGFDTLVSKLYTLIGYCALLLTFLLVSYSLKKLIKLKEQI